MHGPCLQHPFRLASAHATIPSEPGYTWKCVVALVFLTSTSAFLGMTSRMSGYGIPTQGHRGTDWATMRTSCPHTTKAPGKLKVL